MRLLKTISTDIFVQINFYQFVTLHEFIFKLLCSGIDELPSLHSWNSHWFHQDKLCYYKDKNICTSFFIADGHFFFSQYACLGTQQHVQNTKCFSNPLLCLGRASGAGENKNILENKRRANVVLHAKVLIWRFLKRPFSPPLWLSLTPRLRSACVLGSLKSRTVDLGGWCQTES